MINYVNNINWISLLLAFLIYFILGALWFTTFFKEPYARSLGKINQLPAKPAPIFIIGPAICSLIVTFATAILIHALNIDNVINTIEFGCVVGIGYLVANTFNIAINPNIPHPILYSLISGSYHLVGIIIVSLITFWMK